ncbi:MAG TPA: hypothetical protein PLY93_11555 [Turneriella sp.]|nr:hypothetical protein [Turneriella sp.]
MGAFALIVCKHEMHGKCFDEKKIHACGEICQHKDDGKACALQTELGIEQCQKKGDLKICAYMCLFAKDGKDLYCQKQRELCNKPENKSSTDCELIP